MKSENLREEKIVVYKDGSYKVIPDGITWEFENDKDWLVTIPTHRTQELKQIRELIFKKAYIKQSSMANDLHNSGVEACLKILDSHIGKEENETNVKN